jgi:hypothetical protein
MSKHVGRPTRTQVPAPRRLHGGWYAFVIVVVVGAAGWLLWPSITGRNDHHPAGNVLALEAAIDGFSMPQITAKVGAPVTVQLRSLDTPYHTDGGGKHQFAIDERGKANPTMQGTLVVTA